MYVMMKGSAIAENLIIIHSAGDADRLYRPLENGDQVADTAKESGEQVQVVGVTKKPRGETNFAVTYECIRIILALMSPIPTSLTLHDITVDNSAAVVMPINVEVGNPKEKAFFSQTPVRQGGLTYARSPSPWSNPPINFWKLLRT
jgi:hypothetical protein